MFLGSVTQLFGTLTKKSAIRTLMVGVTCNTSSLQYYLMYQDYVFCSDKNNNENLFTY